MKKLVILLLCFSPIIWAKEYFVTEDEESNANYVYKYFGKNYNVLGDKQKPVTPYLYPTVVTPYFNPYVTPYVTPYVSPYAVNPYGLLDFSKIVNNGVGSVSNLLQFSSPQATKAPVPPNRPISTITDIEALTNMTLCYYLGDDVLKSHLQFNDQWKFTLSHTNGLHNYINQLTLGTNILLGMQNYKLKWKGPYARLDKAERYPGKMQEDSKRVAHLGCDVPVFLVFNDFTQVSETNGHKYSGFAVGGPCEAGFGSGYTVIVDQGFYGEIWMGPQVLAHHLLLMLTSDLHKAEDRYCKNPKSILHQYIKPGEQSMDQCAADKLNRSNISLRKCLLDSF